MYFPVDELEVRIEIPSDDVGIVVDRFFFPPPQVNCYQIAISPAVVQWYEDESNNKSPKTDADPIVPPMVAPEQGRDP